MFLTNLNKLYFGLGIPTFCLSNIVNYNCYKKERLQYIKNNASKEDIYCHMVAASARSGISIYHMIAWPVTTPYLVHHYIKDTN